MNMNTAWKNSAYNQLLAIGDSGKGSGKDEMENNQAMLECLRDSASNVYEEFLADSVSNGHNFLGDVFLILDILVIIQTLA